MRFTARVWWLLMLMVLAGCGQNSMVLQGQMQKAQQEQLALSRQAEQLQARVGALDQDNQELGALLAQSRQRVQVLEDQLDATREQLTSVTAQLARQREEALASQKKVQAMTASMQRRGGVTIKPNSSLRQALPQIQIPDVRVLRDGDVVRVTLPAGTLFESHSARLRPEAVRMISEVAGEVARTYPGQRIGIEGHTDSDPVTSQYWRNNHQFSVAQAMAVYEVLVSHARIPANQLTVVGRGSNDPVASNATPAGKQQNRRVELVIYPERVGQ